MVDARLPGPWLHRPEYWELSDHAWRVFTHALMWSADHGTDGRIPPAFLGTLHQAGVPDEVAAELVGRGHWERTADGGFQVVDWSGRKGQSTDAEVQGYLARKRANQAAYRARLAAKAAASTPPVAGRVTGHGRGRVTGHVGAARLGFLSSVSPPPDQGGGGDTGPDLRAHAGARDPSEQPWTSPAPASSYASRPGEHTSPARTRGTTPPAASPAAAVTTTPPTAVTAAGPPSPAPAPATNATASPSPPASSPAAPAAAPTPPNSPPAAPSTRTPDLQGPDPIQAALDETRLIFAEVVRRRYGKSHLKGRDGTKRYLHPEPTASPVAVEPPPAPAAPAPVSATPPAAPAPGASRLHLVTTTRRARPRPWDNPPWRQLALRLFVQPTAALEPSPPAPQAQPDLRPAAAVAVAVA